MITFTKEKPRTGARNRLVETFLKFNHPPSSRFHSQWTIFELLVMNSKSVAHRRQAVGTNKPHR
ncbi:unnamed protein product [Arabidopsis lyrata]|nr:unnamed protein product [Arabidopsis lyrata]